MLAFARISAVLYTLWVIGYMVLGAQQVPDYSHTSQFISELNAGGGMQAESFTLYGLFPMAFWFCCFWLAAYSKLPLQGSARLGYWLLLAQPAAYIMAGVFPCDLGCPAEGGSANNQTHMLLGTVFYLVGILSFFLLSSAARLGQGKGWFAVIGLVWLVGMIMLGIDSLADIRGAVQRIMEAGLVWAVLMLAFKFSSQQQRGLKLFHRG